MTELAAIFKIILVFTTALFAIAQYFDSRQIKIISTQKEKVHQANLFGRDQEPELQDLKIIWEEIQLVTPIDNQKIIHFLLYSLVFIVFLFALLTTTEWLPENIKTLTCNFIYGLLNIYIFIVMLVGVKLMIDLQKMNTQQKNFDQKVQNFYLIHNTVKKMRQLNHTA